MTFSPRLVGTGLAYCLVHNGIVDVDRTTCDFSEPYNRLPGDQPDCRTVPLVYQDPEPS